LVCFIIRNFRQQEIIQVANIGEDGGFRGGDLDIERLFDQFERVDIVHVGKSESVDHPRPASALRPPPAQQHQTGSCCVHFDQPARERFGDICRLFDRGFGAQRANKPILDIGTHFAAPTAGTDQEGLGRGFRFEM
jgi:hypothetical protein